MNYSNHSLRTDLQEWKNRLSRAPYEQFGHQLKYLISNFKESKQILGILTEAINQFPYQSETLEEIINHNKAVRFDNSVQQAAYCFQFIEYFTNKIKTYELQRYTYFQRGSFQENKDRIIENYISPIIYFLHDKLNKSNSIIYLLEKYKFRTEWFTRKLLASEYLNATKNYEQIFEDDLRLFLFDQGIDYPFSTPLSASGRSDIVGEIDTNDPLIVEIKIFDRNKGYGKDRIKDGFSQISKYANDYNKDVGYLVIYNMDKAELNFKFTESNNIFPPSIIYNHKVFYFIVIKTLLLETASKSGTIESIEINESELVNQ